MSSGGVVRSTALRAGGACVRCRKGKTKCVYENGRAPCKNCAKGMHECYLPSESMAHHHGQSPARHANPHRAARDNIPAAGPGASEGSRQAVVPSASARHVQVTPENSPALIRRHGSPTQAAETYASKAVSLINQNLDHPNLADIQALCLIVIHEWGSRNAVRAYIYLGQAARMLQMYRILNTHHSSDQTDQFLRDESLRRTLWLVYILDCLLTSTPGRYSALALQDTADVSLPCSDINFAFGNAVPVKTLPQHLGHAALSPSHSALSPSHSASGEVGEFGYIVLASTIWRDVVSMLTATTLHTFREEDCTELVAKIEGLRASLPMQFVDKPGQINLHMTMGSGYTFAMLHCLLHSATVFVHRRRLLQDVAAQNFDLESFRLSPRCHDLVDRVFTACHGTILLLNAVEAGADKDHPTCLPIVMLFSAFTASATVAYLSLKGLAPPNAAETASHIVRDGLKFMHEGTETWPLISTWLRHLTVMQRVLNNDAAAGGNSAALSTRHKSSGGGGINDEVSSNADTNPDVMDYDHQTAAAHGSSRRSVSGSARGDSEPPVAIPRRGVTTINGGSGGVSSASVTNSPPSGGAPTAVMQAADVKQQSPDAGSNGMAVMQDGQTTSQDMTAPELCQAFERQLIDLDDLAAFMGGGV
ncbi:hypothetical protein UVI_02038680 [Ustilaginoidea virens]|uniref:Zn(2)-C6 fungal-type domain-containing protein n=1 Tax=Ustilaginoidea virens TaxID=1159556 RepID=A0A1B5L1T4_USTVR|nr:hypothetical protein UVI_02038680 [Ustilaginoidea virens]